MLCATGPLAEQQSGEMQDAQSGASSKQCGCPLLLKVNVGKAVALLLSFQVNQNFDQSAYFSGILLDPHPASQFLQNFIAVA